MYLLDEGLLEKQSNCYFPTNKVSKEKRTKEECRSLPRMLQYHSAETVDLIIRGFCEKIGSQKMCNLANVSECTIAGFYNEFRKLIYARQQKELLNYYFINPKQYRYRQFFDSFGFFYIYNGKIYTNERPLRAAFEGGYTKSEINILKKNYSYIKRMTEKNIGNKSHLHYKVAEFIWRKEQDFQFLYDDICSLIA